MIVLLLGFLAVLIGGLLLSDRVAVWLIERSPWLRCWADVEDARETRVVLGRVTRKRLEPLP